jgi:putative phosphonate metabolism protein
LADEPRYALYFVPAAASALYRFGAAVLGYDCFNGADVPALDDLPFRADEWRDLVAAARRYGFHATLKAPFRLAAGFDEAALIRACADFARGTATVPAFAPVVRLLGDFVAIVPADRNDDLDRLAAACVRDFDHFRAPLDTADRERRHAAGLGPRQAEYFERWGYPYVFEDFRFHMTLTGALPAARRTPVLDALTAAFARHHGDAPVQVDRIVVARQDRPDARFAVMHEAVLGAK